MTDNSNICAYADCFSGTGGDMLLGAMIAAGLPLDVLKTELAGLPVEGYRLAVSNTSVSGIKATRFRVEIERPQPHRTWADIKKMIESGGLKKNVKKKSLRIFGLLAEAEAHVHNCPVGEVHFHEVGNIDAIVDIVGAAIGLDYLDIRRLIVSPLPMPRGFVSCEHGVLPLPAPAVCEILQGVPVYGVDYDLEMVTPTGAAIIKAMAHEFGPFPAMVLRQTGYGAGSHKFPDNRPDLLRLVLGETTATDEAQTVEVIETNLDDWSPEGFPYLCDRLFGVGALDVSLVPIHMKKGRPGFLLRVIATIASAWEIRRCVLSETTAIGLRYRQEQRWTLPREIGTLATRWGPLQVKKVETPTGPVIYPEYEDCRRLARQHNVPLKKIYGVVAGSPVTQFKKSDKTKTGA